MFIGSNDVHIVLAQKKHRKQVSQNYVYNQHLVRINW